MTTAKDKEIGGYKAIISATEVVKVKTLKFKHFEEMPIVIARVGAGGVAAIDTTAIPAGTEVIGLYAGTWVIMRFPSGAIHRAQIWDYIAICEGSSQAATRSRIKEVSGGMPQIFTA